LRRRHLPQAQAAGEAEGRQEAHEEHRLCRGAAGGLHRRPVHLRRRLGQGQEEVAMADAAAATPMRDFGVYIHVPFCSVRCGYCDFNTCAPGEVDGATPASYVEAALREMELARREMRGDERAAATVFFGGGTPTMLDAP